MIHFNVRSLQKNIDKLSHYLTDLNRKPDVVAVSETKLKENMIHSNIELDGYQFIHRNSHTQRRSSRPQTPQLGGPRPTLGAQVSLKLLFGYVTIFSSADLFTTDLNCRKKLACDIISECNVILSRRI